MNSVSTNFLRPYGKKRLKKGYCQTNELRLFLIAARPEHLIYLSQNSGVNARLIYRILNGHTRFTSVEVAERLMEAVDLDVTDLKTLCL